MPLSDFIKNLYPALSKWMKVCNICSIFRIFLCGVCCILFLEIAVLFMDNEEMIKELASRFTHLNHKDESITAESNVGF